MNASGLALPFKDDGFDAVVESSVLRHVSDPKAVVSEMIRVARKAVFLVDSNIFGRAGCSLDCSSCVFIEPDYGEL